MVRKYRKQRKNYELIPIGNILLKEGNTYITVLPEYRPALKYLDLFSHALLYYETKQKQFNLKVIQINSIDINNGNIKTDKTELPEGYPVFDIKPYFPCEDRVKEVLIPQYMRKWPKWRTWEYGLQVNELLFQQGGIPLQENILHPIGNIRKKEGEYYLKLEEAGFEVLEGLKDFSHIRILWWFDKFDDKKYRRITEGNPPYENAPRTGIFATRSPVRPNPIATTTARILSIEYEGRLIKVTGLDAFDKTPIISVRPYIPVLDRVKDVMVPDWLKHWPEWLDDRDYDTQNQAISIQESDVERIQKYFVDNQITIPENITDNALIEDAFGNEDDSNKIRVIGARQNNLKNINCTILKNKITVITGVSGSGKSSLAFDTIYSESQRRFMDSMSASGNFLAEQLEKPDVDEIKGLPPAIAIEQKTVGRNPRSTVGTMTDLYDYLRLLFSKVGTRHCPECGRAITPLAVNEIIELLKTLQPNTEFLLYPFHVDCPVGKCIVPLDETVCNVDSYNSIRENFIKELTETLKEALSLGNGAITVKINGEDFLFQTKEMCYHCNHIFFELTASTFSFNNPESMCPVCKGLGVKLELDPDLIVANPNKSILDGASEWWGNLRKHREKPNANWMKGEILALAGEMKVDLELPWKELPESFRKQALYGSEGRFVTVGNTRFPETVGMTMEELLQWTENIKGELSKEEFLISKPVLKEMKRRITNIIDVGLPYLTMNRPVPTLSGGEAQRLRLSSQLSNGITNILYVLDEPSIGLHAKDHERIIHTIEKIRDGGNTVIVVEHDAKTMLKADAIIDIGPGAGVYGGNIIAEGTPEDIMKNPDSWTGRYLLQCINPLKSITKNRRKAQEWIEVKGARHNNLKNIDVNIPLGILTCVTGVSGSGKSSLITKTLYPAIAKHLKLSEEIPGAYDSIRVLDHIDKIIHITQQSIGRTPRSNPATYTGVFDEIRNVFAGTKEAKEKGYKPNKFSFNSREGQCEVCSGEGRKCISMNFMPDIWVECSACHGKRYKKEILEIQYKDKTIADVLDMNMEEALELFSEHSRIRNMLETLKNVGLPYVRLGQSALTLSGGEAQRIKLAKELSKSDTGKTIYLLDEPTTGLHFSDIEKLMSILIQITESGNTVIVIEHNMDVISQADWIIDLGPEGGKAGGYLVAEGTPEDIMEKASYTGEELKKSYKN